MKHVNDGVWGGLSAKERYELRGKKHALDTNDVDRMLEEKDFIMHKPATVVAETYDVDTRTVVRWRNSIRDAQAS